MNGLKRVRDRRADALARVDWRQLEVLLAVYYRGQSYDVEHVGTGATNARSDGGIDLKLRRNDEYVLVQVKHWNAYQVPHNDVHQLLGLMVNEGATGAVLVTSGEFTKAAVEAATRQGHVQLVDGHELRRMLGPVPTRVGAGEQGERALAIAAASTHRGGIQARAPRRGAARDRSRGAVIWWVITAVGAVVFLLVVRALLDKTRWSAGRADAARTVPQEIESSGGGWSTLHSKASASEPAARSAPARTAADPCREVIDHFSGTYIDHCASTSPPKPPSEAEIREQQRLADEAIKVLEATTPEM